MEKQTKTRDTIVVNELLAFVQNKLDVLDELALQQICSSNYKDDEIAVAKTVLFQYATTLIIIDWNPEMSPTKRNMTYIFRFFKETNPDDIPSFVARDLHKLPPVTLDHFDVTTLLQDINTLKNEVAQINKKLEVSEHIAAELRCEVMILRSANGNAETATPATATSPNSEKHSTIDSVTDVKDDSLGTKPAPAKTSQSTQKPKMIPAPAKTSQSTQKAKTKPERSSYAEVSQSQTSEEQTAKTVEVKQQPARECSNVDENGFILVKKKNRARRYVNKRGTGPATEDISAAPTTMFLYISRLDQQTSGDKLLQYIITKSLNQIGTDGRVLLRLTRLESIKTRHFKSYKLQIPAKYKDVFLSSDFWPSGVVFRRYREAKAIPKSP